MAEIPRVLICDLEILMISMIIQWDLACKKFRCIRHVTISWCDCGMDLAIPIVYIVLKKKVYLGIEGKGEVRRVT
jgi:hypothetical protein